MPTNRKGIALVFSLIVLGYIGTANRAIAADAPTPLLAQGKSVDWWFVFKLNTKSAPGCQGQQACPFGGKVQKVSNGLQYVFASPAANQNGAMAFSDGCLGESTDDPVGATFDEIYNGNYFYVIWNDQFYGNPKMTGCGNSCSAPWGHSKGMLAWNEKGEGLVMQVSTPNWPGSGSSDFQRKLGNTLGCLSQVDAESKKLKPQNNTLVSQHFFARRLTKSDVSKVLDALYNASIVTDTKKSPSQVLNIGGPSDIQDQVRKLGHISKSAEPTKEQLSGGGWVISKPAELQVAPWQLVSALLKAPLRAGTWWQKSKIYSTTADTKFNCWPQNGLDRPLAVEIATGGHWDGKPLGLEGGPNPGGNHAKIGVSTDPALPYSIFGDMNQEGTLWKLPKVGCSISQNKRGGVFFVMSDAELFKSVTALLKGSTAEVRTSPTK